MNKTITATVPNAAFENLKSLREELGAKSWGKLILILMMEYMLSQSDPTADPMEEPLPEPASMIPVHDLNRAIQQL